MKWNILAVFLVLALAISACGNQNNVQPDTTNTEVQQNTDVVEEWEESDWDDEYDEWEDWDDEYENTWDEDWS